MSSFVLTLARFIRAFAHGLKDAEFRALLLVLVGLLVSRNNLLLDGRGLGNPRCPVLQRDYACNGRLWRTSTPTTPLSKVFTMLYIVLGVGVFVAFITKVTAHEARRKPGDE